MDGLRHNAHGEGHGEHDGTERASALRLHVQTVDQSAASRPQAGKPLPNRHGLVVSVVTLAVPVVTNPSLGAQGR